MPNWIEGTFRARGEKENIKKFLMEGLSPSSSFGCEEEIKKEISFEEDNYLEFKYTLENKEDDSKRKSPTSLHIPKTRRNFVELDSWGEICVYKSKNSNDFMFATRFKGAWAIDTDAIKEIAKEYEIDIRINGFERGMEFEQLFEVNREGWTACESVIQYMDYIWECPMPLLGG